MLPYLIAGAIGFVVAKLLEEDEAPKYDDGGSVLLAPNGKPSNLTPEQYKLVRTPEFKAWFGDWENDPANASKVVDKNGEPMVCYHSTNNVFPQFKSNNGHFFSPKKEDIIHYGVITMPVFLKSNYLQIIEQKRYDFNRKGEITDSSFDYNETKSKLFSKNIEHKIDSYLKSYSEKNNEFIQIVVFEPEQIKLADGTNTTFDGSNPDIRFAGGGELNSGAFKKWFRNSKVVDKKGNPLKVYHGSPDLRGLKEKYIFESRFADNQSFFFTDNYSMAKSYADPKNAFDYQNAEEGVIGLYLSLQNPLIVNAFNQIWRKFQITIDGNEIIGTRNLIKFAKNKGYDSVIVENVRDYYNNNEKITKGGNVYVAFEPNQIKLADGSNTTFDGSNPDIRYEGGGDLSNGYKLPKYLYHLTSEKIFENIKKEGGLNPEYSKQSKGEKGIYLTDDKSVAENYAGFFDAGEKLILLKISTDDMDMSKFTSDDYELQDFLNDGGWGNEDERIEEYSSWDEVPFELSLEWVNQIQYHKFIPIENIEIIK